MSASSETIVPLRALIVEDTQDDALLLVDFLNSHGFSLEWLQVHTDDKLRGALQQNWDMVFSDYTMQAGFNGTQVLKIVREHDLDVPFIFVSGTMGEAVAVQAMRSGAQDYVLKEQLPSLVPKIHRELREAALRRERRIADETLRKLSMVVNQTADSVFITDAMGHIEYVNPAFEKLTGYTIAEVKGKTPALLRSGFHDQKYYANLWQTIGGGQVFRGALINRRKSGELFHEEKIITPLNDESGRISHYVSTGRDITARVQAEKARNRLAAVLEATPDMVAIFEPCGGLRYLNRAGRAMLGLSLDEKIENRTLPELFPEPRIRNLIVGPRPSLQRNEIWTGETVVSAKTTQIPVSLVLLTHSNQQGQIEYVSTIARDISERKEIDAKIQHKATHDGLTDLPNRSLLVDRFQLAVDRARRQSSCIAVLFLDLNNFKQVNDTLGHAAGDALLQQVARRLKGCLRANDTIARHGGDEFTILVEDLANPDAVLAVLNQINAAFERPLLVETRQVQANFSTGIAVYPNDGERVEELLRRADIAMYQAKASPGGRRYCFYTKDLNARIHNIQVVESELEQALKNSEFILDYQPQLDIRSGRVVCVEGLIRWQHPRRGLLAPAEFIPFLESSGLIVSVGEWVLRQACGLHRELREAGLDRHRVSVNISSAQFHDKAFLDKIRRALRDEGMPPESLEIEITENIVMSDPVRVAEILKALNEMRVRTSLDDFGTGYFSLSAIKRFALNSIKIDRTFVGAIGTNRDDVAIVKASISLAHTLGLEIAAEGVETAAQLDTLRKLGCDLAQGNYLTRPLSVAKLFEALRAIKNPNSNSGRSRN